jgi:sulfide:quinone oxidoreductase
MSLSRRNFFKLSAAGLVGAVVIERSYDYFSESTARAKIVIAGGGAAGITIAAHLCDRLRHVDITIIEPEEIHRYQPGYTLVAADLMAPQKLERPTASLVPSGVKWLQDRVVELHPDRNQLTAAKAGVVAYDFLVVVPGCQMDFGLIEGITPKTVAKKIHDIIGDIQKMRERAVTDLAQGDLAAAGGNVEKLIKQKREEMHMAADQLDFETAALLRDEIRKLQEKPIKG